MDMAVRRTMLVLLVAAGMTSGDRRPGRGGVSSAPVSARAAVAARLVNHQISGTERAVSCQTAARCVAVGSGVDDHRAASQVVALVGGKQARVTVVRSAWNLVAVSCPSRAGCWAMGVLRKGGAEPGAGADRPDGDGDEDDHGEGTGNGVAGSISCNKISPASFSAARPTSYISRGGTVRR